jgi:hypothetical protein
MNDDTTPSNDAPSYHNHKRVLLLGEADYSFARAFAQEFSNKELTATEYGGGPDIASRYHDGDVQRAAKAMSSLSNLVAVKEVICGLNARHLGDAECSTCMCQRWNDKEQDWELPSLFWKKAEIGNCRNGAETAFDLIIFNFPHSEQVGRATRLVRALFKQLRMCIDDGRLPNTVVLEMRLRNVESCRNRRAFYNHEETAEECQFELIGSWPSDLQKWENLGYEHKMTKRNATCRDIGLLCKVWRWRSAT